MDLKFNRQISTGASLFSDASITSETGRLFLTLILLGAAAAAAAAVVAHECCENEDFLGVFTSRVRTFIFRRYNRLCP